MDREWKQVIIIVGIVAILVLGGYVGIKAYSGMDSSMTVVVSGSMQHSDKSTVGIIDTGDMIVMKNKDKGITTYVDGYNNGHSTFGEYGDVIIYNREGHNPVIHRAIVWIDYDPATKIYSADSLTEKNQDIWKTNNGKNKGFTNLRLTLPYGGSSSVWEFSIDVSYFGERSGYLTKGDSYRNNNFDCYRGQISDGLVTKDMVKAVAGFEIPWLGAIKLYANGNTGYIQSNTPFCLAFFILDIVALLMVISLLWDYIERRYDKQ